MHWPYVLTNVRRRYMSIPQRPFCSRTQTLLMSVSTSEPIRFILLTPPLSQHELSPATADAVDR